MWSGWWIERAGRDSEVLNQISSRSWRQKAEFFNDGAWSVFERVSGVPLPAVAGVDSKLPLSAPLCKCTVRLNFSEDTLKQMSEKTHAPIDLFPFKMGGNFTIAMKKICVGSAHVICSRAEDSHRLVQC